MRKPKDCSHTFKSIAEALDTIGILADVLAENTIQREGSDDGDEQLNTRGEAGIQAAIRIIACSTYRDFCQLSTDLGVPE
jgi:hypothetical protein